MMINVIHWTGSVRAGLLSDRWNEVELRIVHWTD
jgi:hypothetical protein